MTFVENVRGNLGSRPPLVAFMIFLAVIAVGLITFAYFVSDMPKAVVDQEYSRFIDHMTGVKFCVGGEDPYRGGAGSGSVPPAAANSTAGVRQGFVERMRQQRFESGSGGSSVDQMETAASAMTLPPSSSSSVSPGSAIVNVTLGVTVEVMATSALQAVAGSSNTTVITTTMLPRHLAHAGFLNLDVEANVSLVLPAPANRSRPCQYGPQGALCYRVTTCLTITAPRHFFPNSPRLLDSSSDVCQRVDPELWSGESHVHSEVMVGMGRCAHNASLLRLHHIHGAEHRDVVFIHDRADVNLHLMHSSYFLFVMVISLFCYAIIRGRPTKVKVIHIQPSSDKHTLIQP